MADPATIMMTLAAAGTVGSVVTGAGAANDQEKALELQKTQAHIKSTQESLARADELGKVMGAQTAQAAANGISLASPSFVAMQKSSFQGFNKDEKHAALSLSFLDQNFDLQQRAIRQKQMADLFGLLSGFGLNGLGASNLNGG